jgi:CBS domain-containing protein
VHGVHGKHDGARLRTAPLAEAVAAMVADSVSHVVAVDASSGRPLGMLSTLDIARTVAHLP